MVFSDTTNKQGIIQEVDFMVNTDEVSFPLHDKVRLANEAHDDITSIILGIDKQWSFDDTNYTDLPIGTTSLVINQQDYSFNKEFLTIQSVELSDSNGKWKRLLPISEDYLSDTQAKTDLYTTTGIPEFYEKKGDSVYLYPSPNYNLEGGLKVYFQRKMNYFEVNDTIKQPGFAIHLHGYVPLYISYKYALANNLDKTVLLRNEVELFKQKIIKHYSRREEDTRKQITTRKFIHR